MVPDCSSDHRDPQLLLNTVIDVPVVPVVQDIPVVMQRLIFMVSLTMEIPQLLSDMVVDPPVSLVVRVPGAVVEETVELPQLHLSWHTGAVPGGHVHRDMAPSPSPPPPPPPPLTLPPSLPPSLSLATHTTPFPPSPPLPSPPLPPSPLSLPSRLPPPHHHPTTSRTHVQG